MDPNGRLDGDVIAVQHRRRSLSNVTTAETLTAYLGDCDTCRRPVREDPEQDKGPVTIITCPDCGGQVAGQRLVVAVTDEVCDAECRGAYRRDCICGCAGANHGRVWGRRISSEEMTEEEALEQANALLKFRNNQLAALKRLKEKQMQSAEQRAEAFNEWIEQPGKEEFVSDLLSSTDPRLEKYRQMIANDEIPRQTDEAVARQILAELVVAQNVPFK